MAKKETIKAENNKTHFDAMRARRKRLKQSSTSYLVSLNGIKTYWSTNRNGTWLTDLWEKRNEKKNHLKKTFVYILTSSVNIVNLFERNISKQDTIFRIEIPVEKRYYRF